MSSPSTQPISSIPNLTPIRPRMAASRQNPESFTGKRAATRHRLMDATAQLIVRDGFDAVSMTSVAEEAGITRQTVYRYFPNARELVRATLMRGGRDLLEGQILVFQAQGNPRELLVEAVMAALRTIRHNPLLRTAWASRDYPQATLRSVFDPSFTDRGVEGLDPIARQLGWSKVDTREAYELIARTVLSFLTIPPSEHLSEDELRGSLRRRLLPALGVTA